MSKPIPIKKLVQIAREARDRAYAPFSRFKVGAAIVAQDGRVFAGCNIENATFGLTICAERVAIFKAVSEGADRFRQIAVVTATEHLTPPCGACRQIIWEFCGDIPVVLSNLEGKTERFQMSKLFPRPFDQSFLKKKRRQVKP